MRFNFRTAAVAVTAVLFCFFTAPVCLAAPSDTVQNADVALEAPQDLIWYASRPVGHTAVYLGTYVPDTVTGFDRDGYDIAIQYDWSIGSDSDWHYTAAWDDYEKSPMFDKVGEDEMLISEAFWLLYDETYEIFSSVAQTEEDSDGNELRFIDFAENTVYMRARYIATPDENGEAVISDWSDAASIVDQTNAEQSLPDVNAPILSDFCINEREVSFCVTSDDSFRRAVLLLKLMYGEDYMMQCEFISSSAEISAKLPYAEGINIISLPQDVTITNEGIMTLSVEIYHEAGETGITALDNIPAPTAISYGSEVQSTSVSSAITSETSSDQGTPVGLSNTQIGAILVGIVVLAIVLAILLASAGKKRRKRSAW